MVSLRETRAAGERLPSTPPSPVGCLSGSRLGIEPDAQPHGRQGQVDEHDVGPGLGHFSLPAGITGGGSDPLRSGY